MKVIIFDTETTGLPERGAKLTELSKWPYIIQLSWLEINILPKVSYNLENHYIKIDKDVELSDESIKIHGIKRDKLEKEGKNIKDVLTKILNSLKTTDYLVAHNLNFDKNMLNAECSRNNIELNLNNSLIEFCTMKYGEQICNIKMIGKNGREFRKFPKLGELYIKLFNETVDNYHNAKVDIICCARCFMILTNNGDLYDSCPTLKTELEC
jgi:DNA polymerase III epsilon subunit-like protein